MSNDLLLPDATLRYKQRQAVRRFSCVLRAHSACSDYTTPQSGARHGASRGWGYVRIGQRATQGYMAEGVAQAFWLRIERERVGLGWTKDKLSIESANHTADGKPIPRSTIDN